MKKTIVLLYLMVLWTSVIIAQKPQRFHKALPAGNYSGITALGNNRYAVVSDKSETEGFFILHIETDSVKGCITSLENEGFQSSGLPNRDIEGICYRPTTNTVFISGEKDNEVYEYTLHLFYTTSERVLKGDSLLRIQSFSDNLKPGFCYYYKPDEPISKKHFYGVSELCALEDGRLLVLERQIHVPKLKLGASTIIRIYETTPTDKPILEKRLVKEFRTRLSLTSRKFANYEGLCEIQGNRLLLIADSQNRFKGFLRDWFLIIGI